MTPLNVMLGMRGDMQKIPIERFERGALAGVSEKRPWCFFTRLSHGNVVIKRFRTVCLSEHSATKSMRTLMLLLSLKILRSCST